MPRHAAGRARRASRFVELGLLLIGLLVIVAGAAWQMQVLPGSTVTLPAPVAFHGAPGLREVRAPLPGVSAGIVERAPDTAQPAAAGAASVLLPGVAQRLVITSIGLDTPVVEGGMRQTASGAWEWETVPFVAVHYAQQTALVGAPGNAVIAGHVATREQGNVFIDLYQVELGDEVRVWDERDALHVFKVVGVKLVPPTDTSVMDETADATLTLMTCGGTFDPVRRLFSDRLVVSAKPA